MKKTLIISIVCLILLLGGCKNSKTPFLDFTDDNLEVVVGETFELTPIIKENDDKDIVLYSFDKEGIVEKQAGNTFKATSIGTVTITAKLENYEKAIASIKVTVVEKSFIVKFVGLNNEVLKEEQVLKGSAAVAPSAPSVEGYTFKGWDQEFNNVTSNLEVKALYEKVSVETYTVTFVDKDGNVLKTETVAKGSAASAPTAPSVEGYTFKGWDQEFTNVTSNLKIKPLYVSNTTETYTVKFIGYNNEVLKTEIVEKGSAASAPTSPSVEGYTFKGWDQEFNNVTKDLEVKAIYEVLEFTVTFYVDGDIIDTQKVKYNESALAPNFEVVPGSGYEFKGWDQAFDKVTSDLEIKAIIEKIVLATEIDLLNEFSVFKLNIGESVKLEWQVLPKEASQKVELYSENNSVAVALDDGSVVAIGSGNTCIVIKTLDGSKIDRKVEIFVEEAATPTTKYTVKFIGFNNTVLKTEYVEKGSTAIAPTAPSVDGYTFKGWDQEFDNITSNLEVKAIYEKIPAVADTVEPEFILASGTTSSVRLNWNTKFDPLAGVSAKDNVDGDLTSKIKVTHNVDNRTYGTYEVKYEVTDKAGNKTEMTRYVEVVWDYAVEFIGHAGSYYGAMNSEEAILYAITKLKYTCVEIDLKSTKDGVFVLSHDDTFGGISIASTNWADLKDVEISSSRTAGYPFQNGEAPGNGKYTAKLCTLDRFLDICKQYGTKAVIELKGSPGITNSDQSKMPALMTAIKNKGMLNQVIFLASAYNCLIWTRNNGYSYIPCQYLVSSIENETYLKRCIDYKLDISTNTTYGGSNSDEWIAKYKEAGIKISTYTYTQYVDYPEVQKWIDKGVDYVTCDWHSMDKLRLPVKVDESLLPTYTVTFKDHDGTILKTSTVKEGKTAVAPSNPSRTGYEFTGWDKAITNVKSDLVVTAKYNKLTYTIKYVNTLSNVTVEEWATKEEFGAEFYSDYYNWLFTKAGILSGISKNGNTITVTKNGKTVSFSNATDILNIDIYDFELTLSNYIYKPVTRLSDGSCVIEPSEDYFLNSDAYREKYKEVDALLMRGIKGSYTWYDDTYTPTSAGKIQIFFRFHQWLQGTTINVFLPLPKKYIVSESDVEVTMPTTPSSYDVDSEITLPTPSSSLEFLGWYTNANFTGSPISKISKGSTGNLVLYAKWKTE